MCWYADDLLWVSKMLTFNVLMVQRIKIQWYPLRLGYGGPPTQLAVSFISHEYHYVGICGDDMLWLWLWGLP